MTVNHKIFRKNLGPTSLQLNKKLDSLQALRGVAALLVLFFHYRFYLRDNDEIHTSVWDIILGKGIIGVDIFFVISGFIMVYTTHYYPHGFQSSKKFLINRVIRIIPLYYFGLLVAFLFGGAMSTFHYPEKVQNFMSALTFTVYDPNITPHYIDDSGMYVIRWTLNYEVYFYLVFSLCLLIKYRLAPLLAWGCGAVCLLPALAGYQPALSVQGYKFHVALYGFLSNPIILEFIIGAVVGYLHIWIKKRIRSPLLPKFSTLVASIILIYLIYGVSTGNIRALQIESTIFIGIFTLALTLGEPVLSKMLPSKVVYLGSISFSLYILHNSIGLVVFDFLNTNGTTLLSRILGVTLAASASILAAHFSHKYIEVKLTSWIKRKFNLKYSHAE
ncbi:acyltransferase [Sodalis endosymbiont of Spalangia cameroni]|uniref:acyltransferase family protein n=1 Tax=Sodalis praecaptivus TaxID=1239307 RepID=UPI0031F9E317